MLFIAYTVSRICWQRFLRIRQSRLCLRGVLEIEIENDDERRQQHEYQETAHSGRANLRFQQAIAPVAEFPFQKVGVLGNKTMDETQGHGQEYQAKSGVGQQFPHRKYLDLEQQPITDNEEDGDENE